MLNLVFDMRFPLNKIISYMGLIFFHVPIPLPLFWSLFVWFLFEQFHCSFIQLHAL